ncbi:hypothetical protein EII34_14335 [Arachnia propionica]|uniref:Uncharacterized protein n=1 Tax=Arachnia propionica TaxID=1750 RepID=A0A3P1T1J2_9ACTN|nr:hypothetical protein [Arachnia propionica]RRD03367.1 hypothetical protein EII34_14335 [Arachnia propionica]
MDVKLDEVLLTTPVTELGEHTLIEFDDGRCILTRRTWPARAGGGPEDLRLRGHGWDSGIKGVDPARSVADVASFARRAEPRRAFRLPPGELTFELSGLEGKQAALAAASILGCVLAGGGALIGQGYGELGRSGLILGVLLFVLLLGPSIHLATKVVRSGEILYRTGSGRSALSTLPLPLDVATAIRQVDEVKETYGRLLSDLAYRISNPALFDAASPETEALTLALFDWDTTFNHLDDPARVRLASRIVASFRQARDHAERVGMDHLPDDCRGQAEKALKAAQLAGDPNATPGEREVALRTAVKILDQVALYYLPTGLEAREALEGRRLRQLPGRSTS